MSIILVHLLIILSGVIYVFYYKHKNNKEMNMDEFYAFYSIKGHNNVLNPGERCATIWGDPDEFQIYYRHNDGYSKRNNVAYNLRVLDKKFDTF